MYKLTKQRDAGYVKSFSTISALTEHLSANVCKPCKNSYGTSASGMLTSICGKAFRVDGVVDDAGGALQYKFFNCRAEGVL